MANSYVTYVGDGVETDFTITIPYLDRDHLLLYVDDVLQTITTHYVFLNSTEIQFVTAPPNLDVVRIRRVSDRDNALATFSNGAMLTAEELNTGNLQNLYLNQESVDELATGFVGVVASGIDSESALDDYVLTADGAGGSAWEEVPTGPTGPAGATGATGAAGSDGADGDDGTSNIVLDTSPQLGADLECNDFNINAIGSATGWNIDATDITGLANSFAPRLFNRNPSNVSPVFVFGIDTNTGLGQNAADSFSLTAGGVEVATAIEAASAVQFIVDPGVTGSAALPSLAFGDGDTGFYESADDVIKYSKGGVDQMEIGANYFRGAHDASQSWRLSNLSMAPYTPAFCFHSDADTGLSAVIADHMSLVAGGVPVADFKEVALAPQLIVAPDESIGSAALPSLSFGGTAGYGFYKVSATNMGLAANGILRFSWSTSTMIGNAGTGSINMQSGAGSVATPAYSFTNELNTGMYRAAADDLGIAAGGMDVARFKEVASAVQLVVDPGLTGVIGAPSLAFGDGDTGIRESTDDNMQFVTAGVARFSVSSSRLTGSNGSCMTTGLASATTPVFCPSSGDLDTGMGKYGADALSLIAGGVEVLRLTEDAGTTQVLVEGAGTAAKPSLAWVAEPNSGFYRPSSGKLSLVLSGVQRMGISSSNISTGSSNGPLMQQLNGTATVPTLIGNGSDQDTGLGGAGSDSGSLIAGGVEVATFKEAASAVQLIVDPGMTSTTALPGLAFGDGDSGFYELADDVVYSVIAGVNRVRFDTGGVRAAASGGPGMRNTVSSATNPGFTPDEGDSDTGIGTNAADQLSLIAGGVECMRYVESAGLVTISHVGSLQGNMITPMVDKTASYQNVLSDGGRTVRYTGATASKVHTIPANGTVAFPIGTMIAVENDGSVSMTVAITTDTLTWSKDNTTGTRTLAAGASCVFKKVAATMWKFSGSALVT